MKSKILGLLAVSLLAGPMVAQATPAWSLDAVSDFRNGSWSFGDVFTVGTSDISVTAIGAYDARLDGFTSTGISVGIFRESDGALLASSTVLNTDPLTGYYRYSSIAALTLLANTTYRVVAVNDQDLYNIATGTPDNVDSRITWDRYGYCFSTSLTRCDAFTGTERTYMANFAIGNSMVPEPGTLALLGLGLLGLGVTRRKA